MEVDINDLYSIRWGINARNYAHSLNVLSKLLDKKESVPVVAPVPVTPTPVGKKYKIALIVGHNARQQGAGSLAPLSKSEFILNNLVVDEMIKNAPPHIEYRKFQRIYTGSYSSEIATVYTLVNNWKPDFCIELHFNAFAGADYTTMLHASTSVKSKLAAQAMQDVFVKELGFNNKGLIARSKGERGGESLYAARAPIVMSEPFFGDNPNHCKKIADLGASGLAAIYQRSIDAVIKDVLS
jgi:N-acetylmuramoyl-L-alanine amidase